jgi:transcriptional regulator with XRE-family HTH domain
MSEESEVASLSLCDVLREFRLERQMSKRALSQRAGLSASYVGKLERGDIDPSVKAFSVIALALELTPQEILFCVRCALADCQPQPDVGEVSHVGVSTLTADL